MALALDAFVALKVRGELGLATSENEAAYSISIWFWTHRIDMYLPHLAIIEELRLKTHESI